MTDNEILPNTNDMVSSSDLYGRKTSKMRQKRNKHVNATNHLLHRYLDNHNERANSTPNMVVADLDESNINNFENFLDKNHLKHLCLKFEELSNGIITDKNDDDFEKGFMSMETFRQINVDLLKIGQFNDYVMELLSQSIDYLFCKVDFQNKGFISWDDFCTYILKHSKADKVDTNIASIITTPRISKYSSVKDTIAKVVPDCIPSRFISVSKDGGVYILSSDLTIHRQFHIGNFDEMEQQQKKRRMKLWVTDCICLVKINKLVIATANRDLQFYDMSTQNFSQQLVLFDLPNVALCLCYHYQKHDGKCLLFFGTENGDVHLLTFLSPNKSLFETPFQKSASSWRILYQDLHGHSRYVTHQVFAQVHSDWIKRIQYYPDGEVTISCSNNAKDSLVYRPINERKKSLYVFRVSKGIECFAYSKALSLLATGGVDHVLRLWDPYVMSKPMAILKTHQTPVIDLIINETLKQVFSYSKDGLLCIWDTINHTCLQSIYIKFPCIGINFDHGIFPLHMTHDRLLVVAEDCIAEFKLSRTQISSESINCTHSSTVIFAMCLQTKNQMISVSENGEKVVWDILTGKQVFLLNKYPNEEVSAATVDKKEEYLVTGTRDGKGFLWNLNTGVEEKQLEAYFDTEITCIVMVPSQTDIFMFGWSRKILAYKNNTGSQTLKPNNRWLVNDAHKDDILAAVFVPANFICTSSYDGEIILWNYDSCRIVTKLQFASQRLCMLALSSVNIMRRSFLGSRSAARRRQSAKRVATLKHTPVDSLLYLENRPYNSFASLVSTEGNTVKMWSPALLGKPVVSFEVPTESDHSITCLCTNHGNDYLFTGDSQGVIRVYDIRGFATIQRMTDVNAKNMNTRASSCINTSFKPPPLSVTWFAHEEEVITCMSCYENQHEMLLMTSSTDCCVSLWSCKGEKIGTFGEREKCDLLNDFLRNNKADNSKLGFDNESLVERIIGEDENEEQSIEVNEKKTSLILPVIHQTKQPSARTSSFLNDLEKIKASQVYKTRSQINNDLNDQKESWSMLGETYNVGFTRRMNDRKTRREQYSEVDKKSVHEYGGVYSVCSPFKALVTSEMQDYTLPEGMPITSRMISKSINPYNKISLENINTIAN